MSASKKYLPECLSIPAVFAFSSRPFSAISSRVRLVRFAGQALLLLRAGLLSVMVSERARLVEERIANSQEIDALLSLAFLSKEAAGMSDIFAEDIRPLGATDDDAACSGRVAASLSAVTPLGFRPLSKNTGHRRAIAMISGLVFALPRNFWGQLVSSSIL
jgi:hypothetical protein